MPHHFLGVDPDGRISVYRTKGNRYGHVVLRGGKAPNYDASSIAAVRKALHAAGLPERIMVDCSHGNSSKDHRNQPAVFADCLAQRARGEDSLIGVMIESNLHEGNQPIPRDLKRLKHGVSVTDKCLGWETTEAMILAAYEAT